MRDALITAAKETSFRVALEVRSQELGKKKILPAPRVTFFMNLKERNRQFLLTGPMV